MKKPRYRRGLLKTGKSPHSRAGELNSALCSGRNDAHKLAILRALLLKLDMPVALGEQSMVTSYANIDACMKARTALAYDDITCDNTFTAVDFYAKSF